MNTWRGRNSGTPKVILKSVLIEGKRLVFIQSWYDYLEHLLEEQSAFRPGRHPTRRPRQSDAEPAAAEMPPPRRRGRPPKFRPPAGDGPVPAVSAASRQRRAGACR